MICPFCLSYVSAEATMNYHEVTSWVNGPKLDGPKLRKLTGRVAHEKCIENMIHGQAPDQPELFEGSDPNKVTWMQPDELDEPVLTDEPGKITKLTGYNSVHHPGGS